MKKKNYISYAVVGVIALLLIGMAMFSGKNLFDVSSTEKDGGFIGVPAYGFLRCQESDNTISYPTGSNFQKFSDMSISCNQFGTLVQGCDVVLKTPSKDSYSAFISNAALTYTKCTIGSSCDRERYGTIFWIRSITGGVTLSNKYDYELPSIHLNKGEYLAVAYKEGNIIFNALSPTQDWIKEKGLYKVYYRPFFINNYDIFSSSSFSTVPETTDCDYNKPFIQKNNIIEYVKGDGDLQKTYDSLSASQKADLISIRDPSKSVAYLSKIVAIIPPAYYQFNGDKSWYCTDKKVYQVETVKTDDGYVYKIANVASNKVLKEVECCNSGDVPVGYFCQNFVKQKLSTSEGQECSSLKQCPIIGYQQVPGKEVVYQECVSNKCVTNKMAVACNFDAECPTGTCQIDKGNPKNNKCIYSQPPVESCGNGVCEASFGEAVDTCPKDCQINGVGSFTLNQIIILVLILTALIIIGMFIIKKKMASKSGGKLLW